MNGTMKQAMLFGVEDIRIVEQPIPDPGPGKVLVKNRISTTCGTDVKNFRRGYPLLKPPHPYGHEFSGVVAAVGSRVTEFRPGDPVAILPYLSCGICDACRSNRSAWVSRRET